MPKRKRECRADDTTVGCDGSGAPKSTRHGFKRRQRSPKRDHATPLRKSARLQEIKRKEPSWNKTARSQLPSPSTGGSHQLSEERRETESKVSTPSQAPEEIVPVSSDPVEYWARTHSWPENLGQEQSFNMSETASSKRRSESSHRSQVIERFAANGVFMETSNQILQESEDLCTEYLEGERSDIQSSIFTDQEFSRVLDRVRHSNEARIQRDIMPWVVPPAEILHIRGELELDYLCEELDAEWIRCTPLGDKKPKPDYAVGLSSTAFTADEIKKLENYAGPSKPFRFTPNLSFPFLICEAKAGQVGLNEADRQNIHSGSLAVKAVIELYRTAFGQKEPKRVLDLYGRVLAFTVSHDNDRVFLYGHFATAPDPSTGALKYYRHPIALLSLTAGRGADRHKPYNFVRNVYDKFAPDHRKRIVEAVAELEEPRSNTALRSRSGTDQTPEENIFQRPGLPASASQEREGKRLEEQIQQQQLLIDRLMQQLEQQRQDSTKQLEQQNEIISLLKAAQKA